MLRRGLILDLGIALGKLLDVSVSGSPRLGGTAKVLIFVI